MNRLAAAFFFSTLLVAPSAYGQYFVELCQSPTKTTSQAAVFEELAKTHQTKTCEETYEAVAAAKRVKLFNSRIQDLSPLQGFNELELVWVQSAGLWDVSALGTIKNLRSLELEDTGPVDFSALSHNRRLSLVSLSYADNVYLEHNLAILQALGTIKHLYLNRMKVSPKAQETIAKMTKLQDLQISGDPRFSDISFIKNMPELIRLNVSETNVSDLSPLADAPQLWQLMLASTPVRSIDVLEHACAKMKWLALHRTLVQDLTPLKHCTAATVFWLSWMNISEIPDFSANPKLQQLSINGNRITDLSPLTPITGLQVLRLDDNQITDVGAIKDLQQLRMLTIENNPLGTSIEKTESNCPTDGLSKRVGQWCSK